MQRARECLDEIVQLYQDGPSGRANELLERIADLYFLTLEQQSAEERGSFGDAMLRMSQSADPIARARFAERIAKAAPVPVELLLYLAREEICVARPILQYSQCLREGDLVSIVTDVGQDHLSATALRPNLTVPVTDLLVQRGDSNVLVALAQNVAADLSPTSVDKLYALADKEDELMEALNLRRDISPGAIRRLKRLGDAQFWQQVAETLLMSADEGDETVKAKPKGTKPKKDEEKTSVAEKPPVEEPKIEKVTAVNEKILAESARSGKVVETVEILARITKLEQGMVDHCLFHAHLPALMVLCKAHRLSAATFTSLLQLRDNFNESKTTDTVSLLRRYESMSPETAQRVIRFADKSRTNNPAA